VPKSFHTLYAKFRAHWKNYVLQSLAATLVVLLLLLLMSMQQAVIISSIGSTAFIVFAMPSALSARARNVIGGHMVGLASGLLCGLIPHTGGAADVAVYAFAVGMAFFLMVITDTEHAPAAGTALGIALEGSSVAVCLAVVTGAVGLSLAHYLGRRYLRDLT